MGRITDLLPALYHGGGNDLTRFTDVLDIQVRELERSVKGITDLINVDRCSDDKLPYLAAYINCPLIGDDPVFWRKQIRNWPYILRLKGTQRSLELVLDSLDIQDSEIKTFFRDERGKYVTDKPSGKPFIDSKGLWRNIRTHYFGIDLTLTKDFVESSHFDWDDSEIRQKLSFWLERGKPYHSELLHLMILPPDFLPDDHICRWDFCEWEHDRIRRYNWGMFDTPIQEAVLRGNEFTYGFYNISDFSAWDFGTWGETPYRLISGGAQSTVAVLASLETDELTSGIPLFWDVNTWDSVRKVLIDTGTSFGYGFSLKADFEEALTGSEFCYGFYCDTRPYWDMLPWIEHCTWSDDVEQHDFSSIGISPIDAGLAWGDNVPVPTWSEHKTWAGSDTWSATTEEPGVCHSKTFLEE